MRALTPTFRRSCYTAAGTFHELRKVKGASKSMISVPLFHLKFLDGIRRLWCGNFKWAAPAAMIGLLVLAGCASDAPVEQPSMYFNMAEPGAKLDAPASTPLGLENLLATVLHALFDVGQLRLQPGIPRDIASALERAEPIGELFRG